MLRPTVSRPVYLVSSPSWGLRPDSYCCQTFAGLWMWGAPCDERRGLSFTVAADPRQRSHSRGRIPRDSWHILLSQVRDSPNLEDQVPVFMSPRDRVAQLYLQAPGSLFVASYDSQGYGGGVRTRLHMGFSDCNSKSHYD
jgi:hypothetical protein